MSIQFCLISPDTGFEAMFAHMLEIELQRERYTVLRTANPLYVKNSDLYIISAEYPGYENIILSLIPPRVPIILYGGGEAPETGNEKYGRRLHYFRRPFLVDDFLDEVRELVGYISHFENNGIAQTPELTLQGSRCGCTYGSEFISLSEREYDLLAFLYSRRGASVQRNEILKEVWKDEPDGSTNVVDVYISYLRKKIDQRFGIRLIKTYRNEGYMLDI